MQLKGTVFIISAASGTGKTSLVHKILENDPLLRLAISHTTRPLRQGEEDKKHYYFIKQAEFEKMIAQKAFLEYAEVHGNYYGTSCDEVNRLQQEGFDVILEIDVQGAEQVKQLLPDAISIFITPPSMEELAKRLNYRNTDSAEVIKIRLANAKKEFGQAHHFDYLVKNDDFEEAKTNLLHIIHASRLQQNKQHDLLLELLN